MCDEPGDVDPDVRRLCSAVLSNHGARLRYVIPAVRHRRTNVQQLVQYGASNVFATCVRRNATLRPLPRLGTSMLAYIHI